jgi:DNA invertase Pin-like site-specific DNA recombinase
MMKPAVIYARVSSKEQEREGFSIPAQLKLLRDYAIRNDFSVVKEFIDIETAKISGRQNFDQMVQFFTKNQQCRTVLVEKTDRLYRNFRDAVTLEDRDLEIHLVKEGQVISKDAKSQAKLIHGMQLVLARNYIENLREEVEKGMREKAEQGIYPGRAPLGYRNNRADRTIEVHPENAALVHRIFELYASGRYSLSQLKKAVQTENGKRISRAYLHTILTNPFYTGNFQRFTEPEMAEKLGVILQGIQIPDHVLTSLQKSLARNQGQAQNVITAQRNALQPRLSGVRRRIDQAYQDKLDGKIPEEFWERKMTEWTREERSIQDALNRLEQLTNKRLLTAQRTLELANKAYSLYLTRNPEEQAQLLRMVLLNCAIDGASVQPTYRKPFDLIFERGKNQEWSGRADLNCRPLAPQASALPG